MKKTIILIVALFLSLGGLDARADVELKFGLYTSDKPSVLKKQFNPVLKALTPLMSEALGQPVKIKFKFSKTYEEGIQDLVDGKVDFVRFGPASYISAKKGNPDIVILAAESKKGKKSFNGVICVAGDSQIQSVGELKGKSFAFGNKLSTIGRYLSQQYLVKNGIKSSDLSSYDYLGSHNKVGIAVARGIFDVGALKDSSFKKLVKKGTGLRSLATFPNMTKPWIARSGLDEKIFTALSNSLLNLKDPAALKVLKKDGFLPAFDADYDVIRSSIDNNSLFFN